MTPDDHASEPHASDMHRPAPGGMDSGGPVEPDLHGPPVLMILAVSLAVVGLVSLAAILISAFLQWTVWPGFVLASYFCLPIAFLLMAALVLRAALGRRRS